MMLLFVIFTKHGAPICELYSYMEGDNQITWSFLFKHHPLERDLQSIIEMLSILLNLPLPRFQTLGLGVRKFLQAFLALHYIRA